MVSSYEVGCLALFTGHYLFLGRNIINISSEKKYKMSDSRLTDSRRSFYQHIPPRYMEYHCRRNHGFYSQMQRIQSSESYILFWKACSRTNYSFACFAYCREFGCSKICVPCHSIPLPQYFILSVMNSQFRDLLVIEELSFSITGGREPIS